MSGNVRGVENGEVLLERVIHRWYTTYKAERKKQGQKDGIHESVEYGEIYAADLACCLQEIL